MADLQGKTVFITGGSRGIGRSIAIKLAGQGANIVLAAKSDKPHPTLKGTIHSVAEEIEAAGGKALPLKVDVRDEKNVRAAVEQAAETFGGIDALINNASAIMVAPTTETPLKRYDLMMDVNVRGTFVVTQACLPYLEKSELAHILTLSPPVNMGSKWLGTGPAYAVSKYGMSIMTLGVAQEYADRGIHANTLWPVTMIDTDAIRVNFPDIAKATRKPEIVADTVYAILCDLDPAPNGQSFTDEEVLRSVGVSDFEKYRVSDMEPLPDIFLD